MNDVDLEMPLRVSPEAIAELAAPVARSTALGADILAWKIGEDSRTVDDGQRGITVTIELTPIVELTPIELTTAMALVINMNSRTPGGNGNYSSAPICTTPTLAQQAILANEQRQFRPISIEVWNETCRTFGPMRGMEIDID